MATALPALPNHDQKVITDQGMMDQYWYRYLRALDLKLRELDAMATALDARGLSDLPDVSLTSLANGEVLVWNSVSELWENGTN